MSEDQRDEIGGAAKDSPVGPGKLTGWSAAGYPQVNGVAVAWLVLEDGRVFDPNGVMDRHLAGRGKDEEGGRR